MRKTHILKLLLLLMAAMLIIPVLAQEKTPESTPDMTAPEVDSDIVLTLERTYCMGTCPVYTVTVYADGTVVYEGIDHVDIEGFQQIKLEPETVEMLAQGFVDAGYMDWADTYTDQGITDASYIMTSLTVDGHTKEITRYDGDMNPPVALIYLENWLENVLHTAQWTGQEINRMLYMEDAQPVIILERQPCFGFCPSYEVVIYDDGTVVYTGYEWVDEKGVQVSQVDADDVAALVADMEDAGYLDWEDEYTEYLITDMPYAITRLLTNTEQKRIVHYYGDNTAPESLTEIEAQIDELVNIDQWIGEGGERPRS